MHYRAVMMITRFDKPVGIGLLWSPVAWALWLIYPSFPPLNVLGLFFAGTVLMRSAGCVINDIADRHVDAYVARTKMRPLAADLMTLPAAFMLLGGLLFFALLVLMALPSGCFPYALAALVITMVYPFCKRFLVAPQLVLGLAFSMAIPMVYVAANQAISVNMLWLMLLNGLWVLAYDTEYAMADRKDDLRLGVRSSAILFGRFDRLCIAVLQVIFHGLWFVVRLPHSRGMLYYSAWVLAAGCLVYQQKELIKREPSGCMRAFKNNVWYGLLMWGALWG